MWWLLFLPAALQGPVSQAVADGNGHAPPGLVAVASVEDWLAAHPEYTRGTPAPPELLRKLAEQSLDRKPRDRKPVTAAWVKRNLGWEAINIGPSDGDRVRVEFIDSLDNRCVGWVSRGYGNSASYEYTDTATGKRIRGRVFSGPAFSPRELALLSAARQAWPGQPLTWYEGIPVPADWVRNMLPYAPYSLTRPYLYPPD